MAKKKHQREIDEVERLQQEIRDLKATNRSMLKRLKKIDREYATEIEKANQDRALEDEYSRTPADRPVPCTHCGKGNIVEIDLLGRKFVRCTICDFRQKKNS